MPTHALRRFRGLNNKQDPLRLGLSWLTEAVNVVVTDSGAVQKRRGFAQVHPCAATSAFATEDEQRLYVAADGWVSQWDGQALQPLLVVGAADVHWCEFNQQVYVRGQDAAGILSESGEVLPWRWDVPPVPVLSVGGAAQGLLPAGQYSVRLTEQLPDGRETGAGDFNAIDLPEGSSLQVLVPPMLPGVPVPAVFHVYVAPANSTVYQWAGRMQAGRFVWNLPAHHLGRELTTAHCAPLPAGGGPVAMWRGRMFAGLDFPQEQQSAIFFSQPLAPHLWALDSDFFLVKGAVLALAAHDAGLVVVTDKALYLYDGERMTALTSYGGVAGHSWAVDREHPARRLLIWTQRGLCQFPEFANLTERRVSLPAAEAAGAGVLHQRGQTHFIASLQGAGQAFNPFNKED